MNTSLPHLSRWLRGVVLLLALTMSYGALEVAAWAASGLEGELQRSLAALGCAALALGYVLGVCTLLVRAVQEIELRFPAGA